MSVMNGWSNIRIPAGAACPYETGIKTLAAICLFCCFIYCYCDRFAIPIKLLLHLTTYCSTNILPWCIQYFLQWESPSSYQCYILTLLLAHRHSSRCPNCSFITTPTCHLGVVGDSHATNVIVGCRWHLPSTSCAMTDDSKNGEKHLKGIYMNLHSFIYIHGCVVGKGSEWRLHRFDVA